MCHRCLFYIFDQASMTVEFMWYFSLAKSILTGFYVAFILIYRLLLSSILSNLLSLVFGGRLIELPELNLHLLIFSFDILSWDKPNYVVDFVSYFPGNQIAGYGPDNETVFGSTRKLGRATEH